MPEIIKTDAIVLRARNYREADQILTLYTLKSGRVSAIVKGVRKPKSKLRGGVQVFSHTNLCLYPGRNLATVTQAETINTFLNLREDLIRMGHAAYLAEFIDALIPEGEPDANLFTLILIGLHLLSVEEPWLITRLMEVRLLMQLGYQPRLTSCVHCGCQINMGLIFAPSLGGILCLDCTSQNLHINIIKMSGETYIILRQLMQMDFKLINRLRPSLRAKKELEEILDVYITYYLGKKLKSKEFLNNLA